MLLCWFDAILKIAVAKETAIDIWFFDIDKSWLVAYFQLDIIPDIDPKASTMMLRHISMSLNQN